MSNNATLSLLKEIVQHPSFQHYYRIIKESTPENSGLKRPITLELKQAVGSLLSFLMAGSVHSVPLIYVCENDEEMRIVESDLFELEVEKVYSLPSLQRRPYDQGAIIDASAMVQRTEVLQKITERDAYIILCSAEGLFDFVQDPEAYQSAKLEL